MAKDRANGSLPAGRHVARVVKQVNPTTRGNLIQQVDAAYAAAQVNVAKHKGRVLGEPRVYVTVEQDFISD